MFLRSEQSAFETREHVTDDGLKIEYRNYSPREMASPVPVLCLHGLTRNLRDFDELAPRIASLGFRVIVPSQRGRGGSQYDDDPSRYTPLQYTKDMLGLMNALELGEAIFVGSSMGGIITMLLSEQQPQKVKAAVLNDIGIELDPTGVARIMGYVGKSRSFSSLKLAAIACRETNGHAFPLETSDEFWLNFAKRVCRQTHSGEFAYDYDVAISTPTKSEHAEVPNYANGFASLRTKRVLLVRGETSDLLSNATVEKMKAMHPSLRYCEVPNIGHVPFLTEPAAWADLSDFLLRLRNVEGG